MNRTLQLSILTLLSICVIYYFILNRTTIILKYEGEEYWIEAGEPGVGLVNKRYHSFDFYIYECYENKKFTFLKGIFSHENDTVLLRYGSDYNLKKVTLDPKSTNLKKIEPKDLLKRTTAHIVSW